MLKFGASNVSTDPCKVDVAKPVESTIVNQGAPRIVMSWLIQRNMQSRKLA